MDKEAYKKLIIQMVDRIDNIKMLIKIYTVIKNLMS